MERIKTYLQFKESYEIDLSLTPIDILESMNIWHDVLLTSIDAREVDIFDELKLDKESYINNFNIDYLSSNVEFINSLSSLGLKKSSVEISDDYQTFLNKTIKWMFIYDINSSELENPIYIVFQIWVDLSREWGDVKFFKVDGNAQNFYDKLSSKTIEINDDDTNYIYNTGDGNTWELQNLEKENDKYKRFFRKEELQKFFDENKVKVSII
jgi:hypothetical protein